MFVSDLGNIEGVWWRLFFRTEGWRGEKGEKATVTKGKKNRKKKKWPQQVRKEGPRSIRIYIYPGVILFLRDTFAGEERSDS